MPESEKLTLNVPAVDLGKMDLLVQEGLYSNRAEFLRAALRSQLEKHRLELEQSVARNSFAIGIVTYSRDTLEAFVKKGEKLAISVIGMLVLPEDVTPALALEAISSIKVRGMFSAPEAVKAALAPRSL
jgi:Arc/MetJ-type ribon-helix-helix transcriptional regulator